MSAECPEDSRPAGSVPVGRLSFEIFALARTHRAFAGELLRGLGLHPGQELLLMRLLERDGQTQSELLSAVGLDHSTVSKALRRMQEAGLLRREPAEHDRRAVRVWLTEKGRAMRGPIEEMWAALERASARDLDERSVDAFVTASERIRRAIGEQHRGARRPGPSPAPLT
ncbi:MarR family transcriptional regulator [Streptomyces sp. AJS327]|uniref:MarR family winged helix-turn-helix transcriptional regulator n=1 Tax=Streptomyces sp. AJS327 TaxID=2545265 RepID=UPI0015DDF06B|nr:MarR family winged helix-turn-helix transcriptional regulator [Streptomyces sp. AJS327]MBA0052488.1 MarR family transcriptional regulator [Streptomyces sp. AJS327]